MLRARDTGRPFHSTVIKATSRPKPMKVKIVTGTSAVQKFFCAALCADNEVVGIFHPKIAPAREKLKTAWWNLRLTNPATWLPMTLLWNGKTSLERACKRLIPHAADEYEKRCSKIATHLDDVNSYEGVRALSRCETDVMICFGGPVYRSQVIASSYVALNYHTGISPVYNGARALYFAFANGHVDLCGGTLMKLSPKIDAGEILSHFLPEIEETDTPATLFVKSVIGGVVLCNSFLQTANLTNFGTVPQGRSFFYYRSRDWRLAHSLAIARNIRKSKVTRFIRPAKIVEYWRLTPPRAKCVFDQNLHHWLNCASPKEALGTPPTVGLAARN